jgi:hypothetical protein
MSAGKLSAETKAALMIHDALTEMGWKREDLTIDQSKDFFGYMFSHPRHPQYGVKAGLCGDIGAIRLELADVTVGEWAELSNPLVVEDVLTNIELSLLEIELYLNEAGVDTVDELPEGEDEDSADTSELL